MMKVIRHIRTMRHQARRLRQLGRRIGFVPTMGALHEGHGALIRAARRNCEVVVVSVFVNPTQFGPAEDYQVYPRDLKGDREQCARLGAELLFVPYRVEMYPPGHDTAIRPGDLDRYLCGPFRPGHFTGVLTVLAKLFQILQPHQVFMGQKDYQQAVLTRQMVRDLHLEVRVVVCPTIRESDGLAMSSRNVLLSPRERKAATVMVRSLEKAREMVRAGERDARRIRARIRALIRSEPLARIEYVAICHPTTLQEVREIRGRLLIALAVRIGKTRLIDNRIIRI